MADEHLVRELLDNYIYQKELILEKSGAKARLNKERLATLVRPRVEKMANLVEDWDVKPDILMSAVFAWAAYNRHPDGPQPNMLFSVKYLTKALGHFLQVPFEVVAEKRSMEIFLERMDYEYQRLKVELTMAGITDLSTAASYPVEVRYLIAFTNGKTEDVYYLSVELLEKLAKDKRTALWMEHRGVFYENVASVFNKLRKKFEP